MVIGPWCARWSAVWPTRSGGWHRLLRTLAGRRPREGSKAFAQDVMAAAGVHRRQRDGEQPGRPGRRVGPVQPARGQQAWVVKDDGLAAGKGVVVTAGRDTARAHAADLLESGHPVLLESFLDGPEVSLFCLVDGTTVVPLLPAPRFQAGG